MSKLVWVELASDGISPIRIFKSRSTAFASGCAIGPFYTHTVAVAKIRHQLWLRSKGFCELGGEPVTEASGHMHEMVHRGKGGEISMQNSVFICPKCHQHAHRDRNPRWKKDAEKA